MLRIGLIAHDGKKPEMVSFVVAHKHFLQNAKIYATGTTGCLLYTSDAADERSSVDLGGRRIIKQKN